MSEKVVIYKTLVEHGFTLPAMAIIFVVMASTEHNPFWMFIMLFFAVVSVLYYINRKSKFKIHSDKIEICKNGRCLVFKNEVIECIRIVDPFLPFLLSVKTVSGKEYKYYFHFFDYKIIARKILRSKKIKIVGTYSSVENGKIQVDIYIEKMKQKMKRKKGLPFFICQIICPVISYIMIHASLNLYSSINKNLIIEVGLVGAKAIISLLVATLILFCSLILWIIRMKILERKAIRAYPEESFRGIKKAFMSNFELCSYVVSILFVTLFFSYGPGAYIVPLSMIAKGNNTRNIYVDLRYSCVKCQYSIREDNVVVYADHKMVRFGVLYNKKDEILKRQNRTEADSIVLLDNEQKAPRLVERRNIFGVLKKF